MREATETDWKARWEARFPPGPAQAHELRRRAASALSQGRPAEAEAAARSVMAAHADAGPAGEPYLTARHYWAIALARLGQHARAVAEFTGLIETGSALGGDHHPPVLLWQISRAGQRAYLGEYEEAEAEGRAVIEAAARLQPGSTAGSIRSGAQTALLVALNLRGMHAEAEAIARQAIADASVTLADEVQIALRHGLAASLNGQGRHDEAESAMRDLRSRNPTMIVAVCAARAEARLGLGRVGEAEAGARAAIEAGERALSPVHHLTLVAGTLLGKTLARQGALDAARSQLRANSAAWAEHFGNDHPKTIAAQAELVQLGNDDSA